MKKIFVLVYVSYDYDRFQDNLSVSKNIKKLHYYITNHSQNSAPVYQYNSDDEIMEELDRNKTCHWLIEEHDCL